MSLIVIAFPPFANTDQETYNVVSRDPNIYMYCAGMDLTYAGNERRSAHFWSTFAHSLVAS